MLTEDPERAREVAEELDQVNAERRHTEQRILFAAEAQVAELGARAAYVLAGETGTPGVVGIVASRIAERYHRPAVLIAIDGATGTGSGRSVAGFDLLGGLNACAEHLAAPRRPPRGRGPRDRARGHRRLPRGVRSGTPTRRLTEDLRHPTERVDAVVAGDELGLALAEELEQLAPFGQGNPSVKLLVPAATLSDPRPMGENRHVRFTVEAGGVRAKAVAFGTAGKIPCDADGPVDATFCLELNEWNGTRRAPPRPAPRPARRAGARCASWGRPRDVRRAPRRAPAGARARPARRRHRRRRHLARRQRRAGPRRRGRRTAPREAPATGASAASTSPTTPRSSTTPSSPLRYDHLVVLDPPPYDGLAAAPGPTVHLVYGEPERDVRPAPSTSTASTCARTSPRSTRRCATGAASTSSIPSSPPGASASSIELELVDEAPLSVRPAPAQTSLDRSPAYRAYTLRLEDGRRFLTSSTTEAGTAPQPEAAAA